MAKMVKIYSSGWVHKFKYYQPHQKWTKVKRGSSTMVKEHTFIGFLPPPYKHPQTCRQILEVPSAKRSAVRCKIALKVLIWTEQLTLPHLCTVSFLNPSKACWPVIPQTWRRFGQCKVASSVNSLFPKAHCDNVPSQRLGNFTYEKPRFSPIGWYSSRYSSLFFYFLSTIRCRSIQFQSMYTLLYTISREFQAKFSFSENLF